MASTLPTRQVEQVLLGSFLQQYVVPVLGAVAEHRLHQLGELRSRVRRPDHQRPTRIDDLPRGHEEPAADPFSADPFSVDPFSAAWWDERYSADPDRIWSGDPTVLSCTR